MPSGSGLALRPTLENLLQWDQMVLMVPAHIQILERHQAFLPQRQAVARGAEQAERDG
jgi:hypothetical protein